MADPLLRTPGEGHPVTGDEGYPVGQSKTAAKLVHRIH